MYGSMAKFASSLGPRCHLHGLTDTVNFPGPNQVINSPAPTSKTSAPCLTIAQPLETWISSFIPAVIPDRHANSVQTEDPPLRPLDQAFLVLNTAKPDLTVVCWFFYDTVPPPL